MILSPQTIIEKVRGMTYLRGTKMVKSIEELTEDEVRSIHIVYRAMHDGICPRCGSNTSRLQEVMTCYQCEFKITPTEEKAIIDQVERVLKRRVADFDKFRHLLK